MEQKKDIALVLSGGGARGIAHIGIIEEIEKRGYNITSIAGTSMGSVVAGVYALGKMHDYKTWLYSLDKIDVFRLLDFTFSNSGLIKGNRVFKKMKEFIPDHNIEELPIPFSAVAVDLHSNKEIIFRKGSVYDALRASVAIPTVIRPVFKDNSILVDGGVLNNIPINTVHRKPDDILVAVNVNADIEVEKPEISKEEEEKQLSLYQKKLQEFKKYIGKNKEKQIKERHLNYLDIVTKTINLMTNKIAEANLKKFPPDILIETSEYACGTFEFYKAKEMVEIGRFAAIKKLDEFENHDK